MKETVLVIDDNAELRSAVRTSLEQSGYVVFSASNGQEGLHILRAKKVDTILLDLVLPDADGLTLISGIRALSDVPVIVISGKGTMTDKVVGLEMGADDYLSKPFDVQELNARVKASIRRYHGQAKTARQQTEPAAEKIRFGGFTLDSGKFQVFDTDGQSCGLTAMEFQLLLALARSPNRVLSRAQMLDAACTDNPDSSDRAIDIQIARIRKKLKDHPKDPKIIQTVRGIGYMFTCTPEKLPD